VPIILAQVELVRLTYLTSGAITAARRRLLVNLVIGRAAMRLLKIKTAIHRRNTVPRTRRTAMYIVSATRRGPKRSIAMPGLLSSSTP